MINNIFQKKESSPRKFKKEKIEIDFREKNSLLPSKLKEFFEIEFKYLPVGDYKIKDTIIERKSPQDFAQSIVNKRLFKQLEEIKQFPNYFLLIEGNPYLNSLEENVIKGTILSTITKYKVPILITKNEEETAKYLFLLSKKQKKEVSFAPTKKVFTKNEQKQAILESFPSIGPKKAKLLLEKFKTLKKIFNSKEEKLKPILGKRVSEFKDLLDSKSSLRS